MTDEVESYLDRPKRYENVDGTVDMFFGLMYLGFVLAGGLEGLLPTGVPKWAHAIAFAGLIPALGLGFWLRKFVKKHWTYKRTGYVAYRRDAKRWVGLAASIVIAAAAVCFFVLVERHAGVGFSRTGMWLVHPAVFAGFVIITGRDHLWKWLMLLVMVLGFVAIGLPVHGDFDQVGWQVLLFLGLVWIGSRVGTLFSYIRHTQPAESQAQ